jgi:hypothetical protein
MYANSFFILISFCAAYVHVSYLGLAWQSPCLEVSDKPRRGKRAAGPPQLTGRFSQKQVQVND